MVLFIVETAWIILGTYLVLDDERKTNQCLYDICSEYPYALFETNVCFCYDFDMYGDEYVLAKTEIIT